MNEIANNTGSEVSFITLSGDMNSRYKHGEYLLFISSMSPKLSVFVHISWEFFFMRILILILAGGKQLTELTIDLYQTQKFCQNHVVWPVQQSASLGFKRKYKCVSCIFMDRRFTYQKHEIARFHKKTVLREYTKQTYALRVLYRNY